MPTSADDVIFDALSNATAYTCTVSGTANCNNISFTNPSSGALTFAGSSNLQVFGNFTVVSAIIRTYTGTLTMKATSGTKTVTTNGVSWKGFDNNGSSGATIQLLDDLVISSMLANGASTFDANGRRVTIDQNGSASASILGAALTFYDLSFIPASASKTNRVSLGTNIVVTNLFTVSNGATETNRVLIDSSSLGTARTITAASIAISNADFKDITGAGAASWDMSAASGGSGDCGGNTMQALGTAAFTASTTQHWTNASGGLWSDSANWTSRVPLPQDDVVMDMSFGTSIEVTANMPRLGRSIDWTGATWTTSLTWEITTATSIFGSMTMINGLTMSGTVTFTFEGRGSHTFTSNDLTFDRSITLDAPGGTLTLDGDITLGTTRTLLVSAGTFTAVNGASNYVISTGKMNVGGNGTLTLGSATHLITGVGAIMNGSGGLGTINAGTSTLKFTDTSNNTISFAGTGSKTYYNIWFDRGASTATNTIGSTTGSNVFNDIKDTGTAAHTLAFARGSTATVANFTVNGTPGNLITINSDNTLTHSLVKSGGGVISCDYLNIQHSVATPASTWYAGENSVNNQGVATIGSGWIFTAAPIPPPIKNLNGISYANIKTIQGLPIASVKNANDLT